MGDNQDEPLGIGIGNPSAVHDGGSSADAGGRHAGGEKGEDQKEDDTSKKTKTIDFTTASGGSERRGKKESFATAEDGEFTPEFAEVELAPARHPPWQQNTTLLRQLTERETIIAIAGRHKAREIVEHVLQAEPISCRKVWLARADGALEQAQFEALQHLPRAEGERAVIVLALDTLDPSALLIKSLLEPIVFARRCAELREIGFKLVIVIANDHRHSARGAWAVDSDVSWMAEIPWWEDMLIAWAARVPAVARATDRMREELERRQFSTDKDYFVYEQLIEFDQTVLVRDLTEAELLRLFGKALDGVGERADAASPDVWHRRMEEVLGTKPGNNRLEKTMLSIVALVPGVEYHGLFSLGSALLENEEIEEVKTEVSWVKELDGRETERRKDEKAILDAKLEWQDRFDLLIKQLQLKIDEPGSIRSRTGSTADRNRTRTVLLRDRSNMELRTLISRNYPRLLFSILNAAMEKGAFLSKDRRVRAILVQYMKEFIEFDHEFYADTLEKILSKAESAFADSLRSVLNDTETAVLESGMSPEQVADIAAGLLLPPDQGEVHAILERLCVDASWAVSKEFPAERREFRLATCLHLDRLADLRGLRAPAWAKAVRVYFDELGEGQRYGEIAALYNQLRDLALGQSRHPTLQSGQLFWPVLKAIAPWMSVPTPGSGLPSVSREVARLLWIELLAIGVGGSVTHYDPRGRSLSAQMPAAATAEDLQPVLQAAVACNWTVEETGLSRALSDNTQHRTAPGMLFGLIGWLLLRGVAQAVPTDGYLLSQFQQEVCDVLEAAANRSVSAPTGSDVKLDFATAFDQFHTLSDAVRYARTGQTQRPILPDAAWISDDRSDVDTRAHRLQEKFVKAGFVDADQLQEEWPEEFVDDVLAQIDRQLSLAKWTLTLTGPLILLDWIYQETGVDVDAALRPGATPQSDGVRIGQMLNGISSGLDSKQQNQLGRSWAMIAYLYAELARAIDLSGAEPDLKRRLVKTLSRKTAKLGRIRRGLANRMANKEASK